MADITGKLRDLVGTVMSSRKGEVHFRINAPNIYASSTQKGRLIPTAPYVAIPDSSGEFTVNLPANGSLLADSWYIIEIHWLDGQGGVTDFPDWQIRVTGAANLVDTITLGSAYATAGENLTQVWLSLTEPKGIRRGQLWWKTDPTNPSNPANTGRIYRGL